MLRTSIKRLIKRDSGQKSQGNLATTDCPEIKASDSCSQTTWLGTENQDWNNPGNWSRGIPNANNHAYIPSSFEHTHVPVITDLLRIDFTLKIDGRFYNQGTTTVTTKGLIQNDGFLNIDSTGTFINYGKVHNSGTIHNLGCIKNKGVFSNSGTIENQGIIEEENTIVSLKTFLITGSTDTDTETIEKRQFEDFNHINMLSE